MSRFFYVCTGLDSDEWISDRLVLSGDDKWIGTQYWPLTQRAALKRQERNVLQFENKPPYKFVRVVRGSL